MKKINDKEIICHISLWFERLFWLFIVLYTIFNLSLFIFEISSKEEFVNFLAYKVFYIIIGFEVIKMGLLRLMEKSNTFLVYHFSIMVNLTFARELVLKHNLSIEIIIGFLIASITLIVTWYLSHKMNDWFNKLCRELFTSGF